MNWTAEKVKHALGGRLLVKSFMGRIICQAILLLPDEIIKHVTGNVWFISSPQDAWAFTFRGSEIAEKHLIVMSEELFQQNEYDIIYTILHEIGHVILGHKNSIGLTQSPAEIRRQELQADNFAKKYLN